MRYAEAIGKHWCLVFVAYSLLHLDCLLLSLMQGSLPIKTIGEACRQQAQALMRVDPSRNERLQLGQRVEDPLRLSVCQATNGCGEMSVCLVLTKSQQASQ